MCIVNVSTNVMLNVATEVKKKVKSLDNKLNSDLNLFNIVSLTPITVKPTFAKSCFYLKLLVK